MPGLESVAIRDIFIANASELKLVGLKKLESVKIGRNCFAKESGVLEVVDCPAMTRLSIGDGSMKHFQSFVAKSLPCLASISVGNECFKNVDEVELVGLSELKSVVVGKNSFTKRISEEDDPKQTVLDLSESEGVVIGENGFTKETIDEGGDSNRHFYLKSCPSLRELRIGCYSFSDYSVCEIENVDALQVIEMGDLNGGSKNFDDASLELKSILIQSE